MSARTDEIDSAVLGMIGEKAIVTIEELCENGARVGTVRNALKRLHQAKLVKRSWEGNGWFGRYLYGRTSNPDIEEVPKTQQWLEEVRIFGEVGISI